ncbi:putative Armadillo beta catenin like repeat [Trypanosoma vivax]|uniref:Vacuolar protein 8 n=1 Tax=Trypanosoma vivax (strain Y486) TaxID=1055687 RepID=G0U4H1_TRYVY|nr:hypothetical protein TRVL_01804 [Trypanosoma vivax]KAH8611902.1 putative Armadillo beta catenin like repeat [Trypanosoma vivax]CCC52335.1 conserved hypothetical protein [Trypanosoma vivax Y486]
MSTTNSKIAALLFALTENEENGQCPLATFARSLRDASHARSQPSTNGRASSFGSSTSAFSLSDVLAERSLTLMQEEESILQDEEAVRITYDKLRAEVARVEAQLQSLQRRAKEIAQQKSFYKFAMNLLVLGEVPEFCEQEVEFGGRSPRDNVTPANEAIVTSALDGPEEVPVSANSPRQSGRSLSTPKSQQQGGSSAGSNKAYDTARAPQSASSKEVRSDAIGAETAPDDGSPAARKPCPREKLSQGHRGVSNSSCSGGATGGSSCGSALLTMLRLPDVKESVLLQAIENYDEQNFRKYSSWTAAHQKETVGVLLALLNHIHLPRPPVQLAELRILGHVIRAAVGSQCLSEFTSTTSATSSSVLPEAVAVPLLHAMMQDGNAVAVFTRLLQSVNDDVKCEVLECLSPLIINSNNNNNNPSSPSALSRVRDPVGEGRRQLPDGRKKFIAAGGLQPLVNIVASCTSEAVLERSLVLLWGLLTRNDDEDKVRDEVRRLGGLRAVLDLLYTDSIPILENVAMTIGYITREEASKVVIREAGGLEKLTATLRHPSESIQTKMAGAVWNCASNAENRTYLRYIGCIPALIELLSSPHEFVQENAAGALWNLSVDPENKTQIFEYGGIAELAQLISKSTSVSVVENASGTLWNCSAAVETRPAIRKAGAIPILLSVLDRKNVGSQAAKPRPAGLGTTLTGKEDTNTYLPISDKILDNVAGTLRNCAINDQNKPVIREASGVELLLKKLEQGIVVQPSSIPTPTLDKLASTLWILTISPEIKHSVRLSDGIPLLTKILEISSTTSSKGKRANASTQLTMSVKEKIVGILRNCSTVQENRRVMVSANVVRALVRVVEDCRSEVDVKANLNSVSQGSKGQEQQQQQTQPSLQLKETVASALWYLSRDDKVAPREEGGLELLCQFLQEPDQPSVVLEQAAGALSSLTVNSQENRDKLREFGGLHALMRLIASRAMDVFPPQSHGADRKGSASVRPANETTTTVNRAATSVSSSGKTDGNFSHTYAVLNALLVLRNSTSSNEENLRCIAEWRYNSRGSNTSVGTPFTTTLLHIIKNGSEDCAQEAALCVKNLCGHPKALEALLQQDAVDVLGGLAERGTTEFARRAAAMTLHSLARARRR